MREPILQSCLPDDPPWMSPATRRLPGIQPLDPDDWLRVDDAYAGQMAERRRLLQERHDQVHALLPGAEAAAEELLLAVLAHIASKPGFALTDDRVSCPDGHVAELDRGDPMTTLGRIVQEDFCLLQKEDEVHRLTAAVLCFPASWSLSEKIGRGLPAIHDPVDDYDDDVAQRVQRLFDAIRPERPLWRSNALLYDDPALYQPRSAEYSRDAAYGNYIRSERQCLIRLPQSGAVVFSIHTTLILPEALTQAQAEMLALHPFQGNAAAR